MFSPLLVGQKYSSNASKASDSRADRTPFQPSFRVGGNTEKTADASDGFSYSSVKQKPSGKKGIDAQAVLLSTLGSSRPLKPTFYDHR